MLHQRRLGDVDLLAGDRGRHRDHHGELARIAAEVVGHRDHRAVAVADQHHLRGFVEERGVGLGDVEAAEGVGARRGAEGEPGGEQEHGGLAEHRSPPVESREAGDELRPLVARRRNEPVDHGHERRGRRQCPHEAVRAEQLEVHVPRTGRDQHGEGDAADPGVGRRLRVGDHEEAEEQEGAALEAVKGDRQRLAERQRPSDQQCGVCGQEGQGHVASGGAVDDQHPGAGHRESKRRRGAPLARRHPGLVGREEEGDEGAVGRIEDVLAAKANHELGADRDRRGDRRQPERVGAEEQTEAERRDERALGPRSPRGAGPPVADPLHRQRGRQGDGHLRRAEVETEPAETVNQERRQGQDLAVAGVRSEPVPGS